MDCQDIVVPLERIATSLESMDYKTPEVLTITQLINGLTPISGIDFEQLEALLNILGALPGIDIRIDPLKFVLEWIWKSQVLANQYAQSTAQGAIATALSAGGVLDGVLDGIDLAKDGGQLILEGILAGSAAMDAITSLVDLVYQADIGEPDPSLRAQLQSNQIHADGYAAMVQALTDLVGATNELCSCGAVGGVCCCGSGGSTQIVEPPAYAPENCPPEGFDDLPDWTGYKTKAVYFVLDKIFEASTKICTLVASFEDDYKGASVDRLSIQQVYQRQGLVVTQALHSLQRFNLTAAQQAELLTDLTNRYYNFASDVFARVPETDDYADVIDEWYNVFCEAAVWYSNNAGDLAQEAFDLANDAQDVFDWIANTVDDAMDAAATVIGTVADLTGAKAIAQQIFPIGFVNAIFYRQPTVDVYPTPETLTGNGCYSFDGSCIHTYYLGSVVENTDYLEMTSQLAGNGNQEVSIGLSNATIGYYEQGPSDDPGVSMRYELKDGTTQVWFSNAVPPTMSDIDIATFAGTSPFTIIVRQLEC